MDREIHISLIPDGNRRWAKKKGKPYWYGHQKGAENLMKFANWCGEHPEIKTVSIYALSTENLNRSKEELKMLWNLYDTYLNKLKDSENIKKNKIKINVIGNERTWSSKFKKTAKNVMRSTKDYTKTVFNIMISYGSKYEIARSIKNLAKAGLKTVPSIEKNIYNFLLVNKPVDLIIRTGGEHRLSNFLLYQAAYSEIYFSNTLWPDFSKKEFEKIIKWYNTREKRMGK